MQKRNSLEIIKDILSIIRENKNSIKTTPLIRKSNLSTKRFSQYLKKLTEENFIIKKEDGQGTKVFSLTEKGFQYLEKYRTIVEFIDEFDL